MRQILVQVPKGRGGEVVGVARDHGALRPTRFEASDGEGRPIDVVLAQVPNERVGEFVDALEPVPDTGISFFPLGSLTLRPPPSDAPPELTRVTARSALEVFIGGLQSLGTWTGMVGYAALAGVIVWLGLFTNTVFLLVGAMLVAPYAGPAMNAAIATARGDARMLGRSVARYAVSLAITAAVTWLLSLAFRQEVATAQMVAIANVSSAAFLLPVAAGAAGALHLSLAERNSLVSGAAVGLLVAASLAPPAGLVGMAAAIGEWAMLKGAVFLLGLQLVGINLAGAVVFRFFELDPTGPRYERGTRPAARAAGAASVLGLAALLAWQFGSPRPELQRATVAQRIHAAVVEAVAADSEIDLVDTDVRFPRPPDGDGEPVLVRLWVRNRADAAVGREADEARAPGAVSDRAREPGEARLRREVSERVRRAILRREPEITPLVAVTVVGPPGG